MEPGVVSSLPRAGLSALPPGGILFPWLPADGWTGQLHELQLETGLPPPSAARSLRVAAGAPVTMVTVSFSESTACCPQALTMAMLRPELFRVVLQTSVPCTDVADGLASAWTHTREDWQP